MRFSLRTLLIVMLLGGPALWLAAEENGDIKTFNATQARAWVARALAANNNSGPWSAAEGAAVAWKRSVVAQRERPRAKDDHDRFFGFLEGRLNCAVPRWWEMVVQGSSAEDSAGVAHLDKLCGTLRTNSNGWKSPQGTSVVHDEAGRLLIFEQGERKVSIRDDVVAPKAGPSARCSALFGDGYRVILIYPNIGVPATVVMTNAEGKLLWKAKTLGSTVPTHTGPDAVYASCQCTADAVFVFAACASFQSLDGFSLADGQRNFFWNSAWTGEAE